MDTMSVTEWNYEGFTLSGGAQTPYYLIGFKKEIEIHKKEIHLDTGDTLSPGDTVAYLGGHKTSAGFSELHPVAPVLFRYDGVIRVNKEEYVIWSPVQENGTALEMEPFGEFIKVRYAHGLIEGKETFLVYTNRAGAGRIVETKIYFSDHDKVPEELYPKEK